MNYDAEIPQIKRLLADVEDFCAQNSLTKDVEFALNLLLEEIFTNICLHGYNGKGGKVDVEMSKTGGLVKIEISDEAPDFIKNFADGASYKRVSNKNVLTILKNIA